MSEDEELDQLQADELAEMDRNDLCNHLCWFCKHFDYSQGFGGSEVTPGESAGIECYKDHWRFSFDHGSEATLAACIQYARHCPDFTLKQAIVDEVASLKLGPRTKQFKFK